MLCDVAIARSTPPIAIAAARSHDCMRSVENTPATTNTAAAAHAAHDAAPIKPNVCQKMYMLCSVPTGFFYLRCLRVRSR